MKTNVEIETVANSVLLKYVKKGGVYKVFQEIIHSEKIKYKEVKSENTDFVGALTKIKNQAYIFVNKDINNIGRKYFTTANELVHYFLAT